MFTLSGIIFLLIVAVGVAYWQSSARSRELATRVSKQMCEKHKLQFLDGTTIQDKQRLHRGENGRLGFERRYHFDFYNGDQRLQGRVTVFQYEITELYLENPLPDVEPLQQELFKSANETSNVIQFPNKNKK